MTKDEEIEINIRLAEPKRKPMTIYANENTLHKLKKLKKLTRVKQYQIIENALEIYEHFVEKQLKKR